MFTWNENVAFCIIPFLGDPGLVIYFMGILKPMRRDYVEKEAREYFDTNVYKFNVPRNVTLSEAPSHGLPAIIYDLKCSGSQAYIALAKEFLERSNINGSQ